MSYWEDEHGYYSEPQYEPLTYEELSTLEKLARIKKLTDAQKIALEKALRILRGF